MKNLKQFINFQNGLVLFALLIVLFSIYYTNNMVKQIAKGEQKLVDLYAKGLQAFVTYNENDAHLTFLLEELMISNETVPVILADFEGNPVDFRNLDVSPKLDSAQKDNFLRSEIEIMKAQHTPIEFEYVPGFKNVIYYKDSPLLVQLKYFPMVLLLVISIFIGLSYFLLNSNRKAEQNRVWVGLARETAHQLGTPLSSLMAWIEYMKEVPEIRENPMVVELEKDTERLRLITERFSTIGSVPVLKPESIVQCTEQSINYIQPRVSKRVIFNLNADPATNTLALLNVPLYDWVVETLCKNAIDAMEGIGQIDINIEVKGKYIHVDFKDSGKGIPKGKFREVFKPGFTTKKRGWGLGLSLSKRIIENYHKGRIMVLASEVGKFTVFRVILKKL